MSKILEQLDEQWREGLFKYNKDYVAKLCDDAEKYIRNAHPGSNFTFRLLYDDNTIQFIITNSKERVFLELIPEIKSAVITTFPEEGRVIFKTISLKDWK